MGGSSRDKRRMIARKDRPVFYAWACLLVSAGRGSIVLNIREYLENGDKKPGEDKLVKLLSEFSCPLISDAKRFLKQ